MSKKGLVLGILALVFCWVPVAGLVLGIIGLVKSIKAVKIPEESKGKSITGIALSGSAILSSFLFVYIWIAVALISVNSSASSIYDYNYDYYDYSDYDYDYDWDY